MSIVADPHALPKPGDILAGKYRVDRLIGKGGMGAVFAAHHQLLGQHVAIKLLLDVDRDAASVARFLNEGRAAASIRSEHVARVYDVGVLEDRRPFIVMEYLEGRDLAQVLEQSGPLPPEDAVDCILQAALALAQAHALGIVHRDLKPSNLFLADRPDGAPVVKVLDFGISKAIGVTAGAQAAVTTHGLIGSPAYMSPEQVRRAKSVETRSDMWSLGVILYELLSGRLPFSGENVGEILAAILETPPTSLSVHRPDLPPGLSAVVMRCLQQDPARRYADVADLAEALAPFAPPHAPSIARIRTTMAALAARPSGQPPPRASDASAARGVQTNDSWSDGVATRPGTPSPRAKWFGFVGGASGVIALAAVLNAVFAPAPRAGAAVSPGVAAAAQTDPSLPVAPPVATDDRHDASPSIAPPGARTPASVTHARPRPAKPAPRAVPSSTPSTPPPAAPALARDRR